jgi:hypothetical protein
MSSSRRLLGLFALSVLPSLLPAQETRQVPETKPEQKLAPEPVKVDPRAGGAPTGGTQSGGNTWFPVTSKDLGTFFGSGDASGIFTFKNPHDDKAIEWRQLTGSCQCTKAVVRVSGRTYELSSKPTPNQLTRITKVPGQPDQVEKVTQITIEPGATGEVEVHLDMAGITGNKQASLDIHTTDEVQSHLRLNFHANGAQLFTVSPAEVNLNKMTWSESREFTVTVASPMQKDWNIKRMDDAGKGFKVTYEKVANADSVTWTIRGTYGPVDGESAGGGLLKFYTDIQGESSFTVRVMALVQGPLEVKPGGFLPLGLVRKGTGLKKEIVFEPNDGFALEATALKFEKLSMGAEYVTASTRKDGNKLIVELQISDQTPTGMLKGDLVVELNHPLIKDKRIMFNGFVR